MRTVMRVLLLAAFAAFFLPSAWAAPCAEGDHITRVLETGHGQELRGVGIVDFHDITAELWVGPDGRWTLIARATSGKACVESRGHDWIADPKPEPPPYPGDE